MSGMEVASLVLGAPPLILLALDNYSRAIKPFKQFGRFSSYIEDLRLKLKISSITFRNVIEILLSFVWSKNVAQEMLSDTEYPQWQSNEAEYLLRRDLGPNYDIVIELMHDIANVMGSINQKLSHSASSLKGKEPARAVCKRQAAANFLHKVRLAFQEDQLDRELRHVDRRVEVLRSIINHNRDLGKADTVYRAQESRRYRSESDIAGFEVVQHSSRALFDTVKNSCNRHKEHYAHLRLNPTISDLKVAQISFDLIFGRSVASPGAENRPHTFRLSIQSCLRSQQAKSAAPELIPPRATQNTNNGIARSLAVTSACLATESRRKRVKFEDEGPKSIDFELDERQTLPDFLIRREFCVWLAENVVNQPRLPDQCIGLVDRNARCQLSFHVKNHKSPVSKGEAMSLKRLLCDLRKRESYLGLAPVQKCRYAKILASAVMNFQNTPWLTSEKLRSENILFYSENSTAAAPELLLPDPYINVPISSMDSLEMAAEQPTHIFIRNRLIFRLGIMLLELALEEPMESLQLNSEKHKGGLEGEKETAERLLPAVRHRNGPRYEGVVRRCLRIYAGEEPLHQCEESLRKSYCSDVVDELRDLEAHFRAIDVGEYVREKDGGDE